MEKNKKSIKITEPLLTLKKICILFVLWVPVYYAQENNTESEKPESKVDNERWWNDFSIRFDAGLA